MSACRCIWTKITHLKMALTCLSVVIMTIFLGSYLADCEPLYLKRTKRNVGSNVQLDHPLSPLDLETECEPIRLRPEPVESDFPEEEMHPKYENVLRDIGAERNLPVPGSMIDKLWDKYIEEWSENVVSLSSGGGCRSAIAQFCMFPTAWINQDKLKTALTYAYFYRAKRNLQLDRIVEAFVDISHAKHLRSRHKGISIERIYNLEKSIRLELLQSCRGDIERLLNVSVSDKKDEVELAYKKLDDLTNPSLSKEPNALRGDVEVIRKVIKIAYDLKMTYSRY